MEYSKFTQLVKGGEKANVDFKIKCDAFLPMSEAHKAELAKDICAMANNGYIASYILVGVDNDGKSFMSVSNLKLIEENVQTFSKTAIFPPPKIKVHSECWSKALLPHKGKKFVIIQIGPQARQAFRLAKDFMIYQEKISYRRNDVWIRRGSTSDLATPEEISRLVKGEPYIEKQKIENDIEYDKLPTDKQGAAMWGDLQKCIEELGGSRSGGNVAIPIKRSGYVFNCCILFELKQKLFYPDVLNRLWRYGHGVLLLVKGAVSKSVFPERIEIHFKEKWGWFTGYGNIGHSSWDNRASTLPLPANMKEYPLVVFTLPHIKDTEAMRSSFFRFVEFLKDNPEAYNRLYQARTIQNSNLNRWLKQGWFIETNRIFGWKGKGPTKYELEADELFNRRYSDAILKRVDNQALRDRAQTILNMSNINVSK